MKFLVPRAFERLQAAAKSMDHFKEHYQRGWKAYRIQPLDGIWSEISH